MDETQPEEADAIPEEDNKDTNEAELKYGTPAYIRWRKKVHHDDTIRAAIFREGTAWAIINPTGCATRLQQASSNMRRRYC